MSLPPWRVRLVGSTAGTLDQVIVQVELVDRALPPQCPAPWFWVRGDDLEGLTAGDPVTSWTDRGFGGNNLGNDTGKDDPIYVADVIDGIPGIGAPIDYGVGQAGLRNNSFEKAFPDGMTIFHVVKAAPTELWQGMFFGQTGSGDNAFFFPYVSDEGILSTTGELYAEFIQTGADQSGFWYAYDTGYTHPSATMWRVGPSVFECSVNNVVQEPDGDWSQEFDTPSWSPVPAWRNLQLFSNRTTEQTAEVIVFDSLLTPECESLWWAYLAGRYPSAF